MKLLKSLSVRTSFMPKMAEKVGDAKTHTRDSSTDLSSPTKSTQNTSRESVKVRHSIPEAPIVDLENDFTNPPPLGKKKKKGRKSKRVCSVTGTEMVDDSMRSKRSEMSNSEPTPKSKKGKRKKKKRIKGGSSRRSEASAIRQSILSAIPSEHEEVDHTSRHSDTPKDEAWLGNFVPHQPIRRSILGPQPMPHFDEKDENDYLEEKSMRSFQLGIPPNKDDQDDTLNGSKLSLAGSCIMDEEQPPIGELVVGGDEDIDDDVSDIGEPTVVTAVSRTKTAPDDQDVCFQDRGQPGTRAMTKVIRNLLDENEDAKYTISMGKLIRKKLRGRRFMMMERQDSEVYWREAEKKEVNKLISEFFNEERRRKEEGMTDDDSDENSSLQDSAKQSEEASISIGELNDDDEDDDLPPPPPPVEDSQHNKPATPKTNNSNHRKKVNTQISAREALAERLALAVISSGGETTSELLSQICEQRKIAEDYALPFSSYEMMENGRKAHEKLQELLLKHSGLNAKTKESDELSLEIHKMHLIVERVMYASIGPLLEMLERMDEMMNGLEDEMDDEKDVEISPPPTLNPKLPKMSPKTQNGKRLSGAMRKNRTIAVDTSNTDGSQSSLNSVSQKSRTIRSGSKRSRESRNLSSHSFGSGSKRNMDQEGHPRRRSFFNESKLLDVSGVSIFYDDISDVSEGEIRNSQSSDHAMNLGGEHEDHHDDKEDDFDEGMEDTIEVEIPLNDEGDYESIAESSGYSGSREKSVGGLSNKSGSSFGIEHIGNQQYIMALKGGSSGHLSPSDSFTSDALTPSRSANSFRHSFESIGERRSNGSQLLRMEQVFQDEVEAPVADESQRSTTKSGKFVEVTERGRRSDDMSSVGNSQRRLHGSDDSGFEDMDISDQEDDEGRVMSVDSVDYTDDSQSIEKETVSVKTQPTVGAGKLEQFFDRLQHFFEVRRKVEERADIIDPAGKCRRIKMKCPTKLVPKSNGEYGKVHQQKNMNNKVVKSLDELYAVAERAKPALLKVLDHLTDDVMGLDMQSVQLADLKPRDRAFEKAKEEFGDRIPGPPESWLCDVARASVICKSYKQMNDVNKWIQKTCDVVKAKNRFLEPAFNGYRDLMFHIIVPYDGTMSHICEIQVHHRDMNALDRQFGMPKHYEFFRSSFAGPRRSQEDTLDDLALMNKHGDMGSIMAKLLRSKEPDQLRLFARLCRDKLDEFDKALELYRRILVLQSNDDNMDTQDHENMADTHMNIGLVYGSKGEIDESLYHLQKALEIQEEGRGTDNVEGAELMTEIGRMLSKKGDFEGALTNFEQALEIRENAFGNEHFMVISSLQDIGKAFGDMGDYAASEVSYRKALKLQEQMLDDVHPDIATTSRLIGTTLCKYGDFGTAMELHRLALSIRETALGKNHPMTAESQTDIGIVLCQKGDLENAEWRHRKALRIRELKGKDDEDCAISLSYLGDVLSRKGEYTEAIKVIKRAQQIRENGLGMDHPVTAATYIDLGNVYYKQGNADLALKEYRRAKVARESMFGFDHQETATALSCLGNALNLQGDYEAAHHAHMQALDVYAHFLGEGHPLTATGYQNIADTLLLVGDKEKALVQHRKALAIRANVLSKDHPDTALSCSRIGDLLAEKDDLVGALVAHKQALAITIGLSGDDTVASAKSHIHVGLVLAAQGEFEEAMEEFDQATSVLEKILGENHEETARAYGLIGSVHSAQGEFDDAFEMHSQALEVFENLLGTEHPKTSAAANKCKMAKKRIAEREF